MRRILAVLATALGLSLLATPAAFAGPPGHAPAAAPASTVTVGTAAVVGAASTRAVPAAATGGDACSFSPDRWGRANFAPACQRHDACYARTSTTDRQVCDTRFRADLYAVCNARYSAASPFRYTCRGLAQTYYGAVRTFGSAFYKGKGLNN